MLTSAVATVGFLVLTRLPASGGYSPLLAAVMLVGFGTAGTAFGTMVTASHGVADQDQGLVGGVINTSRQVGAAIGAALLPAVAEAVNHSGRAAGTGGDRAAMLAGAVAAALALAVALRAAGGAPAPAPRLTSRYRVRRVPAQPGSRRGSEARPSPAPPARARPGRASSGAGSSEPAGSVQLDVAGYAGDRPAADPDAAAGVSADVHPAEPSDRGSLARRVRRAGPPGPSSHSASEAFRLPVTGSSTVAPSSGKNARTSNACSDPGGYGPTTPRS